MKILTLNTWQKRGPWEARWQHLLRVLAELSPDVVAFQEVFDEAWANEVRRMAGYPYLVSFGDQPGLVLLSRFPARRSLLKVYDTASPSETYRRYAVFAEIETSAGTLGLYNTHLSWLPPESLIRQGQVEELLAWVESLSGRGSVFLAGDFNASPETPEVEAIVRAGFRDVFAEASPRDAGMTWSHRNPFTHDGHNRVQGDLLPERRIDYLFFRSGGDLQMKTSQARVVFQEAGVEGVHASDHFGVMAELL